MTQAVEVLNRYGTDLVGEARGSDSECLAGFECFLNIVRALGMGSCISEVGAGGGSPPLLPYSPESNADGGKRRRLRGSSSFDFRVPGRMFLNGSSEVASMYCKQGRKGINQDAMLVWENFCSREDTIFCGVFDGHGPYGHRVAKRVRDSFPLKLNAQWDLHHKNKDGLINHNSAAGSYNSEKQIRLVDEKPSHVDHERDGTNTILTLRESFLKASKIMDKELKLHPDIDCFCSGTTAVTLVKQGLDLVIGNVGDSRAVLGTRDHDDSLIAVQLTIDLKPNLPKEEERIRLRKGRVFSLPNEQDVSRVWLPNSDFPGLAMARAFGDFCLKDFGLISVPDVSYHRLTEKDEFVVLATDGVRPMISYLVKLIHFKIIIYVANCRTYLTLNGIHTTACITFKFGMFYQMKKLWTLWHLLLSLLLLEYLLSQLFKRGGQNSLFVRLMIVPQCASSLIQIQTYRQQLSQTRRSQRHQLTNLSSHLYLVRWELQEAKKSSNSIAFVPCLFPSLAGFIEKVGKIVL